MKRIHPLLVVAAAVVVIGGAVAWNEGRRGYDEAKAVGAPVDAQEEEMLSTQRAPMETSPPPYKPDPPGRASTAGHVEAQAPGTDATPPVSAKVMLAQELVRQRLKDPDSAQFRDARVLQDGTICMEVNGKNGFGGYTGFSHAVVMPGSRGEPVAWVDSEPEGIARAVCSSA
ncbi:hypothetical protein V3391_06695 [Luteimonas sp. SMYT11W]|uniref:Uncharacterized protein n=1 Tax=Luteimonas flava TaxID=3115822 RepID=A0ABU7WD50_9GAMM